MYPALQISSVGGGCGGRAYRAAYNAVRRPTAPPGLEFAIGGVPPFNPRHLLIEGATCDTQSYHTQKTAEMKPKGDKIRRDKIARVHGQAQSRATYLTRG